MARRKAKPIDPMAMGEQHTRCPWTQLKEQDRLLAKQPAAVIAKQRAVCRRWLAGEVSWQELLGHQ